MVVSGPIDRIRERIMGGTVYELAAIGPAERLPRNRRRGPPGAARVEEIDGLYRFTYRGDPGQASDLLVALVRAGVRVAAFGPKQRAWKSCSSVGAKELS